jgi:hypothetical protein
VETALGAFDESEPLVAVHDTLASDPVALGPSVSCDPDRDDLGDVPVGG